MSAQGQLFDPDKVNSNQFTPDAHVQKFAQRVTKEQTGGKDWQAPDPQLQVDSQRGYAQYQAYKGAQANPSEAPGIRDSYASMRTHVNSQFELLTKPEKDGGMGFTHEVTDYDPYPSPAHAAADIAQKRIKTFSTASTGGHEYFSNEENDKFRAVHDVFGHASTGRGFSRHGEEAGFQAHKQMFPSEAHAALTSETRGQNSYLNFGGGGFPDQGPGSKLIGLPQWASETSKFKVDAPRSRAGRRQGEQGKLFP